MAAAQGEIIDAERGDHARLRQRCGAQQAKQGVPAGRHAQPPGQASAGPAGKSNRDRGQRLAQRRAVSRVRGGQTGDLLGERDPSASNLAADQPTHQQLDHDPTSRESGVCQPPPVAAVHPGRLDAAARTRRPGSPGSGFDHDSAVGLMNPIDRDFRQVRQQPLKIAPRSAITVHTRHHRHANAEHHKIIARAELRERRQRRQHHDSMGHSRGLHHRGVDDVHGGDLGAAPRKLTQMQDAARVHGRASDVSAEPQRLPRASAGNEKRRAHLGAHPTSIHFT
jgi:hypothetical protein